MESTNILQDTFPKKQSKITRLDRQDCSAAFAGGGVGAEFISTEEGGGAERIDMNTGESLPSGGGSPNSHEPMQVNTEARVNSIQECALADTLKAVRGLRDEYFQHNPNSRPSLLLAQTTFILERIQHGIPCGKEPFLAVLRVAGLVEEKPAREMVEVP